MWLGSATYALTRSALQRGLGLVLLIAFVNAVNQFRPLLGDRGLLPVSIFVKRVRFRESPSLFYLLPHDLAFTAGAWLGVVLSCLAVTGAADRFAPWTSVLVWAVLWIVYLSFVNVGQDFYGFGWESILLEACFYAVFLGSRGTASYPATIWLYRWLLFRIMFGAGLIKLRADPCWRDLTCLNYYYETQPMPNPLSWFFHVAPEWTHQAGVIFNHFAELIVPFAYFLPQPICAIAGIITILFQGAIFLSGNLSWLNFLTMVLAMSTFDDRTLSLVGFTPGPAQHVGFIHLAIAIGLVILVAILSVPPIRNMLSPRQVMNTIYNRLHLVGTYGAFGSITRPRFEVIIEGTEEMVLTASTKWREYEFKGKPGDPRQRPPQIAPYHLRLDWLMWFAAFSSYNQQPWFVHLVAKLLLGDRPTLGLLRTNPFPDHPPKYVRALLYEYRFLTREERAASGDWWAREYKRPYFPAISLGNPAFRDVLERQGWREEYSYS
jgi:Lipase maturation factor